MQPCLIWKPERANLAQLGGVGILREVCFIKQPKKETNLALNLKTARVRTLNPEDHTGTRAEPRRPHRVRTLNPEDHTGTRAEPRGPHRTAAGGYTTCAAGAGESWPAAGQVDLTGGLSYKIHLVLSRRMCL
jgi:hypothetical protein